MPLQENIEQLNSGKHNQWRGYITVLVVNHGMIKSITILTAVIRLMIKYDVDYPLDCFRQEIQ
jgi:hypothetical protein